MRRNIDPDYKFEKGKFADALKKALEGRSYSAFARDADLSFPYISKYMNLKAVSAPTIATIKKLSAATTMISYEELLEAAGYDSTKYVNTEDAVESIDGISGQAFTSYFNSIFSAVTKADFNWHFSNHSGVNGKDPFTLEIEGPPFKEWYFIPITKIDVKKEDIVRVLSGSDDFTIEPNSKVSFMTTSQKMFDSLDSMELGIIYLYISIFLINPDNGNIEKEKYVNTAIKILEDDKEKYSIVNKEGNVLSSFYSL